jgi:hypothetical protein
MADHEREITMSENPDDAKTFSIVINFSDRWERDSVLSLLMAVMDGTQKGMSICAIEEDDDGPGKQPC